MTGSIPLASLWDGLQEFGAAPFKLMDETMPTTPHIEKHFTATETVRDIVIGMADGLTVPFALAAGLAASVIPAIRS